MKLLFISLNFDVCRRIGGVDRYLRAVCRDFILKCEQRTINDKLHQSLKISFSLKDKSL